MSCFSSGHKEFTKDVKAMIHRGPYKYFIVCWVFVSPVMLMVTATGTISRISANIIIMLHKTFSFLFNCKKNKKIIKKRGGGGGEKKKKELKETKLSLNLCYIYSQNTRVCRCLHISLTAERCFSEGHRFQGLPVHIADS